MKYKKISVFGNRKSQNWAKQRKIEIKETRQLYNAYGNHYFYRTVDKYIEISYYLDKVMRLELEAKKQKETAKKPACNYFQELEQKIGSIDTQGDADSDMISVLAANKLARALCKAEIWEKYENCQEIVEALYENYNRSWRETGSGRIVKNDETTIVYNYIHNRDSNLDLDYVIEKVGNAIYRHNHTDYDTKRMIQGGTDADLKAEYTQGNALV